MDPRKHPAYRLAQFLASDRFAFFLIGAMTGWGAYHLLMATLLSPSL